MKWHIQMFMRFFFLVMCAQTGLRAQDASCSIAETSFNQVNQLKNLIIQFIKVAKDAIRHNKPLPAGQNIINILHTLLTEFSCEVEVSQLPLLEESLKKMSDIVQRITEERKMIFKGKGEIFNLWKEQVFDLIEQFVQILYTHIHDEREVARFVQKAQQNNKYYLAFIEQQISKISELIKSRQISSVQEAQQLKWWIDEMGKILDALAKRMDQDTIYIAFEQSNEENFSGTGISPEKAYEFIGIDRATARNLTVKEINNLINKKFEEVQRETGKTVEELKAGKSIWRQLGFIMANDLIKENYDAFLFGPRVAERIALTPDQKEKQSDIYAEKYLPMAIQFAELEEHLRKK